MTTEWIELNTLQDVAKAQADGWEIEVMTWKDWCSWLAGSWNTYWKFRARPRQPKMKKVKMECFHDGGALIWWDERNDACDSRWIRIPAQDIEIEIPEGV